MNTTRRRGLTGKQTMNNVAKAYEQFRENGVLPATYEVVYGHAWAGNKQQQQRQEDGSIAIPISKIQRRRS